MDRIHYLNVDVLQSNPLQPRGVITQDSLLELAASIKEHGILEPLVVAETPAGYQLIAGERRWRAAKLVGMKKVPAVIKKTTPQGMLEMALVENVQRDDLNALDRAKAFDRLINEFNLTIKDITKRIGKSTSYVCNTVRLLKLPDAVKDGLLTETISEGHARALAGIPDERALIEAYKVVLKESASVRKAERMARMYKIKGSTVQTPKKIQAHKAQEETVRMKNKLSQIFEALGAKQHVIVNRSIRKSIFTFTFTGGIEATQKVVDFVYNAIVSEAKKRK